jgi:hypothetical protein
MNKDEITHFKIEDEKFEIKNWVTFFGIWLAEGCIHKQNKYVVFAAHKQRVKDELTLIAEFMVGNLINNEIILMQKKKTFGIY